MIRAVHAARRWPGRLLPRHALCDPQTRMHGLHSTPAPETVVPIGAELDRKIAAACAYASQIGFQFGGPAAAEAALRAFAIGEGGGRPASDSREISHLMPVPAIAQPHCRALYVAVYTLKLSGPSGNEHRTGLRSPVRFEAAGSYEVTPLQRGAPALAAARRVRRARSWAARRWAPGWRCRRPPGWTGSLRPVLLALVAVEPALHGADRLARRAGLPAASLPPHACASPPRPPGRAARRWSCRSTTRTRGRCSPPSRRWRGRSPRPG